MSVKPPSDTHRSARAQRGQALLIFIMAMTVIFFIGAITVDIGLWLSERRGSQKDADVSALAGAWELIDPAASESEAIDAAGATLADNDQQLNASFASEPDVDLVDRCISVDVRHDSNPLFFSLFGLGSPDVGAHAKACAGAAQSPGNLVPFQIDNNPGPCFDVNEEPIFTSMCPIELGAQGGNPRGMVDIQADPDYCSKGGGSGDIEQLIITGAQGICLIEDDGTCDGDSSPPEQYYDCVFVQTGNPKKVLDGTHTRISADGLCDAEYGNNDGTDDFFETVEVIVDTGDPYTSIYDARDCDPNTDGKQISPRLVTIFVFEDPPTINNFAYPVIAIAGFYIAGCADESVVVTDETDLDRDCNSNGVRNIFPGQGDDGLWVSSAVPAPSADKAFTVTKVVVGGTAQPSDFTMTVWVNGSVFTTFPGQSTPKLVSVPNGSQVNVTETGPVGYVQSSSDCTGNIGNGRNCVVTNTYTVTPTLPPLTPTPPGQTPSPTPAPTPNPGGGCSPSGHCVVYGRFVNIVYSGGGIGPITDQTTVFSIALVE